MGKQGGHLMKCITTAECERQAKSLNLSIEGEFLKLINGRPPASQEFKIPDSARRQALAVNELKSPIVTSAECNRKLEGLGLDLGEEGLIFTGVKPQTIRSETFGQSPGKVRRRA
jgi:hypothetical protein